MSMNETYVSEEQAQLARTCLDTLSGICRALQVQIDLLGLEIQNLSQSARDLQAEEESLNESLYELRLLIKQAKKQMVNVLSNSIQDQVKLVSENLGYVSSASDASDIVDLLDNQSTLERNKDSLIGDLRFLSRDGGVSVDSAERYLPVLDNALSQLKSQINRRAEMLGVQP